MLRLTAAQAVMRFLAAQEIEHEGHRVPLFGGVWAIFGHGNVGGIGQALTEVADRVPTLRGHDEQAMGHAAIGYAKAWRRRRAMVVTTSIGPGATNLVTAAATAHVNRLPVLLLPGDIFADRVPDPVLQQLEYPLGPDTSVNDCLRPVSRYFDRLHRPEALLRSLPDAMRVLTDPAETGPVTLAFPQDVQAEVATFPASFFAHRLHRLRRVPPDPWALEEAAARLHRAHRVLIIAGGGVRYSKAETHLLSLAENRGWPVAETQAGKGSLSSHHRLSVGGVGVTGTSAANTLLSEADAVLAVGTRMSDFTTGSARLFPRQDLALFALNVHPTDAAKHGAFPVVGDADLGLFALEEALSREPVDEAWLGRVAEVKAAWTAEVEEAMGGPAGAPAISSGGVSTPPSDAEVLWALRGKLHDKVSIVAAAGGLPGELHKLWAPKDLAGYFVEYGYSCMGHEIAGGLGVKLAAPDREVWVLVGDGSYLMLSAEISTSIALGVALVVLVLDNRGFGCIDRLDRSLSGGHPGVAGNLRKEPVIDLVGHARALGAWSEVVEIEGLSTGLDKARNQERTSVLVIRTEASRAPSLGGAPWRVPSVRGGP